MARDEAKRAQVEVDQLKCSVAIKKNIIRSKDYQVRHYKGELTKLKKKVAP